MVGILPFHHFGCFERFVAISHRIQVTDLPGSVHLVAHTPVTHVVRIAMSMLDTQV